MPDLSAKLPRELADRTRFTHLGGVPALIAHPDWSSRRPCMIWWHGRTANKELDPGRYLRWIRAGIGAVALDLPGHGERFDAASQLPGRTLAIVAQALREVDPILEALAREYAEVFDAGHLGLGGMSAGGMVTLRRLCDPHPFVCAAVEATAGSLEEIYWPTEADPLRAGRLPRHPRETIRPLNPIEHLEGANGGWRPIPLLALHSESDRLVPIGAQRRFVDRLRSHYASRGTDPGMVALMSWASTGAPEEHAGFGRFSNDAKNAQVQFLARWLGGEQIP